MVVDFEDKENKLTEERIAVMQAFLNGKTIQTTPVGGVNCVWKDLECPTWNWANFIYRIKPEPHYVPYCSPGEFFDAARVHNLYLRKKGNSRLWILAFEVQDGGAYVSTKGGLCVYVSWKTLLKDYEWADGTRCGIVKD